MKRILSISVLLLFSSMVFLSAESITDSQKSQLVFLFEEEKLARDVYMAMGEKWGLRVFDNISMAEINHMEHVKDLAYDYGLSLTELPPGEFNNQDLKDLYNSLIEKGVKSLKDALEVGRLVEETDISDIDKLLADNPDEDMLFVLNNLRRGSENHLRAFNRQLDFYN